MVQQVTDEDGTVHQFPDDASPDEMNNAITLSQAPGKAYSSVGGTIARQAGLIGRDVVEGVTSLPSMIANIPAATANGVRAAGDWAFGVPQSSPSAAYVDPFGQGMTAMGVPQAGNAYERMEGDVIKPLAGVGATAKAAGDLAKGGAGWLESVLAKNPSLQAQAAVGGGVASGVARENGASPLVQGAVGLAGSLAAPASISAAMGIKGALSPFTNSGKQQIAANAMATFADDPQKAAAALQSAPQYVAGSTPTAGTASGDYGLMNLEKTMANEKPFSDLVPVQNKARLDALEKVSGTPADIDSAKLARDQATTSDYQLSKSVPIKQSSIQPIISQIDSAVQEVGAGTLAGKQLLTYKSKIQSTFPNQSNPSINQMLGMSVQPDATVPSSQLIQHYREMRDMLQVKSLQENALTPAVKAYMQPINHALSQTIEAQNPIFAQAQQKFRTMSEPISQMQTAQDLINGVKNGGQQDAEGNFYLSPAKLGNLIKNGQVNTPYKGWQNLQDALSPQQYAAFTGVQKDVARSNLLNSPAIKTVGSNSNLAGGNALNNATGGLLTGGLPIPFVDKAYAGPNEAIKEIIRQAMQDPAKAQRLLMMGKPNAPGNFLPQVAKGIGTAIGAGQLYGN